jgi:hypothetical protein
MRREKVNAPLRVYVPDSLREQLELFAEQDNVISMSDFLRRALDEYTTQRIAMQKGWRNQAKR